MNGLSWTLSSRSTIAVSPRFLIFSNESRWRSKTRASSVGLLLLPTILNEVDRHQPDWGNRRSEAPPRPQLGGIKVSVDGAGRH
jgi:hypothetical protein